MPVPLIVPPPGDTVTVHVPEAGNPLRATLPVGVVQSGCVIVPMIGADGVGGCGSIVAPVDATDVQPKLFSTVKVYEVFAASPVITPVVPLLVRVAPPGDAVTVHVPEAGNPLKATLPVGVAQSG